MTGGRKSELTAKTDDYSTVGEIGVKMTSTIRNHWRTMNWTFGKVIMKSQWSYACPW